MTSSSFENEMGAGFEFLPSALAENDLEVEFARMVELIGSERALWYKKLSKLTFVELAARLNTKNENLEEVDSIEIQEIRPDSLIAVILVHFRPNVGKKDVKGYINIIPYLDEKIDYTAIKEKLDQVLSRDVIGNDLSLVEPDERIKLELVSRFTMLGRSEFDVDYLKRLVGMNTRLDIVSKGQLHVFDTPLPPGSDTVRSFIEAVNPDGTELLISHFAKKKLNARQLQCDYSWIDTVEVLKQRLEHEEEHAKRSDVIAALKEAISGLESLAETGASESIRTNPELPESPEEPTKKPETPEEPEKPAEPEPSDPRVDSLVQEGFDYDMVVGALKFSAYEIHVIDSYATQLDLRDIKAKAIDEYRTHPSSDLITKLITTSNDCYYDLERNEFVIKLDSTSLGGGEAVTLPRKVRVPILGFSLPGFPPEKDLSRSLRRIDPEINQIIRTELIKRTGLYDDHELPVYYLDKIVEKSKRINRLLGNTCSLFEIVTCLDSIGIDRVRHVSDWKVEDISSDGEKLLLSQKDSGEVKTKIMPVRTFLEEQLCSVNSNLRTAVSEADAFTQLTLTSRRGELESGLHNYPQAIYVERTGDTDYPKPNSFNLEDYLSRNAKMPGPLLRACAAEHHAMPEIRTLLRYVTPDHIKEKFPKLLLLSWGGSPEEPAPDVTVIEVSINASHDAATVGYRTGDNQAHTAHIDLLDLVRPLIRSRESIIKERFEPYHLNVNINNLFRRRQIAVYSESEYLKYLSEEGSRMQKLLGDHFRPLDKVFVPDANGTVRIRCYIEGLLQQGNAYQVILNDPLSQYAWNLPLTVFLDDQILRLDEQRSTKLNLNLQTPGSVSQDELDALDLKLASLKQLRRKF